MGCSALLLWAAKLHIPACKVRLKFFRAIHIPNKEFTWCWENQLQPLIPSEVSWLLSWSSHYDSCFITGFFLILTLLYCFFSSIVTTSDFLTRLSIAFKNLSRVAYDCTPINTVYKQICVGCVLGFKFDCQEDCLRPDKIMQSWIGVEALLVLANKTWKWLDGTQSNYREEKCNCLAVFDSCSPIIKYVKEVSTIIFRLLNQKSTNFH